jgi:hypothetical protein
MRFYFLMSFFLFYLNLNGNGQMLFGIDITTSNDSLPWDSEMNEWNYRDWQDLTGQPFTEVKKYYEKDAFNFRCEYLFWNTGDSLGKHYETANSKLRKLFGVPAFQYNNLTDFNPSKHRFEDIELFMSGGKGILFSVWYVPYKSMMIRLVYSWQKNLQLKTAVMAKLTQSEIQQDVTKLKQEYLPGYKPVSARLK